MALIWAKKGPTVCMCVLIKNASNKNLSQTKENEIILNFLFPLEESRKKSVVSPRDLQQSIRQLQLHNRRN
jgi:hypothetical protein